ncbi:hypothetical protein CspHIS471_0302320 [Cutaneotrichosporon sp. HIS471]|nr:hypothetical protein CspHIS471_0302320 [Cutaneotrichosporon sp. HIS471]
MGVPVVLAIVVGLACSFIQSLGLTIQRKSHVQDEALPLEQRTRAVRRPLWIIGFAIYISSNIFGSVFQIGALPIVVLAPLGGVSLLWNSVLAHVLLGESFTSAMLLGTVFIATGAVLIAIFGVVQDGNHSLDELLHLWARGPFIAFFAVVCLAVLLVLAAAHMTAWRVRRRGIRLDDSPSNYASPHIEATIPFRPVNSSPRGSISSISGLGLDVGGSANGVDKTVRFAELDRPEDHTLMFCGLAFAAASGTLSGLCLVLAKSAIELVIATIEFWSTGRGQNEFTRIQSWFIVAGLVAVAVLQIFYLNFSLTFASPALICPLAFCFYNLASIFDGLVFYNQLDRLSAHQIVLVSIGVAVLLVGVWAVSAVQPTGDGGVEVGTWAEEGDMEQTWFEEAVVDEPFDDTHEVLEPAHGAVTVSDADSAQTHDHDHPVSAPSVRSPPPKLTRIDAAAAASANIGTGPYTGAGSPVSPTLPRRRRPRYGTLIPDLAPSGGMPTGFAFGIGAASPGFALRSHSVSHRPAIHQRSPSISPRPALPFPSHRRARAQSEAGDNRPSRSRVRMSLPAGPSEDVAATLAAWDDEPPRRTIIGRVFGSGGVKLP